MNPTALCGVVLLRRSQIARGIGVTASAVDGKRKLGRSLPPADRNDGDGERWLLATVLAWAADIGRTFDTDAALSVRMGRPRKDGA